MAADDEQDKKAATSKGAPAAGELTFLVSTNPHDAQSAADKKRVRQAAALKSWRDMKSEYVAAQPASKRHKTSDPKPSSRRLVPRPEVGRHDTTTWELALTQPTLIPPQHTSTAGTASSFPTPSVSTLLSSTSSPGSTPPLVLCPSSHSSRSISPVVQTPVDGSLKRSHDQYTVSSGHHLPPHRESHTSGHSIWTAKQFQFRHAHSSDDETKVREGDNIHGTPSLGLPVSRQYHSQPEQHHLPTPSRTYCNDLDPFGCSPIEHKPWHDGILHHMLTVFAPRAWPTLKITNEQGLQWEHFMTQHALAEPALYCVRLLFATGDLIALKVASPQLKLCLQAQAIQAINEALTQPQRATSDALILAIGRISLHESLYGDKVAAHALHRPAQQRMIVMRGGMGSLDFPPLVKRLMRWSDKVMSMQGGTPRMIPDDDEPHYTDTTSVDVLEKWAPSEGKALREKVRRFPTQSPRGRHRGYHMSSSDSLPSNVVSIAQSSRELVREPVPPATGYV